MSGGVVMAVDGNSLVHRSYHAQARTGQASWAVRGLLSQLVAAVERVRPVAVVIGFDDPDSSWRRETWPQYKANRTDKLETLVEQLVEATEAMRRLGVAVVVPPGLEADDVLSSTAAFARRSGLRTVVVTSDRDSFALISDDTSVLRIIDGGVDASPMMTPDRLQLLLGVRPEQYRDFAALRGDPSDNLPGVRGVGARTAARLLAEFGTARAAFDDLDAVRDRVGKAVATRMAHPDARPGWELNCQVMTMRDDIEIELDLTDGPGVMPLPADAVSAVYAAHRLTWTGTTAIRVLAEVEPADVPPVIASANDRWHTGGRGHRTLPKLPPPKPRIDQLSLF